MRLGELEPSRAMCPLCRTPVEVPFAPRTIEVTRVCERCGTSWRVTATPLTRPGWFGIGQVTRVSFLPES